MRSTFLGPVGDAATPAGRDAALARHIGSCAGYEHDQSRAYDAALEELSSLAMSRAEIHRRELALMGAMHDNAGFAMIDGAVPGARRPHPSEGGACDTWLDLAEVVAADVAATLRVSEYSARQQVATALRIRRDYRDAARLLGEGGMSELKLRILLKETIDCPPEALPLVEGEVLLGVEDLTPKRFGDAVRAAVIRHAPESVSMQRRKAAADRQVSVRYAEAGVTAPGMGTLFADLPNLTLRAMDSILDSLAATGPLGDARTVAQRRADTLTALVLGPGHLLASDLDPIQSTPTFDPVAGTYLVTDADQDRIAETLDVVTDLLTQIGWTLPRPVTADIRVLVPATVLTGGCPCGGNTSPGTGAGGIATVDGLGPVDPDLARQLTTDARWTRLLTDPVTGAVTDVSPSYRFPAAMRRRIHERDQTCRYPGCHRPAAKADIDHVIPHPNGATAGTNAQTLCRTHHRLKHQTHWHCQMTADGVMTWTSPTGRQFITHPPDLR